MSEFIRTVVFVAAFMGSVCWSLPAEAQTPKLVNLTCQTGNASGPQFVAEVQAGVGAIATDFKLTQTDLATPHGVVAERSVHYGRASAPITLVALIQGNDSWVGSSHYDGDGINRYPSVYPALIPFLNTLVRGAPKRAKGALLEFRGAGARFMYPLGPLAKIATGLGARKNYRVVDEAPLVVGLATAIIALSKRPTRRILVIVGDGSAQVPNVSEWLHRQKRLLEKHRIETYVAYYAVDPENKSRKKKRLFGLASEPGNAFQAHQLGDLSEIANKIRGEIASHQKVIFPTTGFTLDGKSHQMQLSYKKELVTRRNLVFCAGAMRPAASRERANGSKKGCGCAARGSDAGGLIGLALFCLLWIRPRNGLRNGEKLSRRV